MGRPSLSGSMLAAVPDRPSLDPGGAAPLLAHTPHRIDHQGRVPFVHGPSHGLADVGPSVLRVGALDGLQEDHPGTVSMELVCGPGREEHHVATPGPDDAHLPTG